MLVDDVAQKASAKDDGSGASRESLDRDALFEVSIFRRLTRNQRKQIFGNMREVIVLRGEDLVVEGDDSDAFFVVVRGAFVVRRIGDDAPIADIGPGDLIGEIGFFGKIPRTATVVATRDSSVLALSRTSYQNIVSDAPEIVSTLLEDMALRVADATSRIAPNRQLSIAKTVAVVEAGHEPIPELFYKRFREVLSRSGAEIVTSERIMSLFPGRDPNEGDIARWFSALEQTASQIIFLCDRELTKWTEKFIRQSDNVLFLCRGDASGISRTEVELAASMYHKADERRLVRVHDERSGEVRGTSAWLKRLPVFMHHHVSLQDDLDIERLVRFLLGRAVGFVAAGGGGFGPCHLGIYKAFCERGTIFDIFVGTSVGAAMAAGFAKNFDAEDLDRGTHDIFVRNRSFKRPTWPRYSLLDHKAFDKSLAEALGEDCEIEDCWRPFAAVATNLSTQSTEIIRTGRLWHAVRASAAIPGILPPFYTSDGSMLVDGCLVDNIPLAPMHKLKRGPNVVAHFGKLDSEKFHVDYNAIPGRFELISNMLLPFGKKLLPRAPTAINVLWRSMLVHQRVEEIPLNGTDYGMRPPTIPGAKVMDFDNHKSVFEESYYWAKEAISTDEQAGNRALLSILSRGAQPWEL